MSKHRHFLVTTASLVLFAAISVTPGLAQQNSRVSTPEEMAETRALNLQNINGIERPVTDGVTYGGYVGATEGQDYSAAASDEPSDEDIVVAQNYDPDADEPVSGNANAAVPPPPSYPDVAEVDGWPADANGLWTLDRFSDPSNQLFNVRVEDINGFTVGRFRRVEDRDNGDQVAVITLRSMRTISLLDEDVRYDPDRAVLVTVMTIDDIDVIPSGWSSWDR
jgi:hypothetical protein